MKLQRQLLISFISVALLPLIAISAYMYQTNVRLAFDLYQVNLSNSTEIQAGIINDNIRQFLVQSTRFAASSKLMDYLSDMPSQASSSQHSILDSPEISREILQFTDKTLDTVSIFAIIDRDNHVLYASGSNRDSMLLSSILKQIPLVDKQTIYDYPWDKDSGALVSATPIKNTHNPAVTAGMIIAVYNNDYFVKSISSHKQVETSNSFIYCSSHNMVIKAKQTMDEVPADLSDYMTTEDSGLFTCAINGKKSLNSYQHISNTPWFLINTIPEKQIYSTVFSSIMVNMAVFALCLLVVILLSMRQSRHILYPLSLLLQRVEQFFMSGGKALPALDLDKRTEIGYLSDKFTHMAGNITAAQEQLNESNYLYTALIHATYDLIIRFHFDTNEVKTSNNDLSSWFETLSGMTAREKVLRFFEFTKAAPEDYPADMIRDIAERRLTAPIEMETCCRMLGPQKSICWYRIIVVPILSEEKQILRIVLHFEDITLKKMEEFQLVETSQKDPLCGLLNKQAFISLVGKHMASRIRKSTVFFIDLDNFKQVNDTLGHRTGDEVLIRTAQILSQEFRTSDLVARYGGDEFIIFASGLTVDKATQKAEDLLHNLDMKIEKPGAQPIHVTASIGIYMTETPKEPDVMIALADKAMYRAKQKGKFQYYVLQQEEEEEDLQ